MRLLASLVLLLFATAASAEQFKLLGAWQVHYVLFPTTFLTPDIASRYGVRRADDLSLLNISVLSQEDQTATVVAIEGAVTNLLGQRQTLRFDEVRDGDAIYYLAQVRHTDREVLRFEVALTPPDDKTQTLRFQQQVYVEDGRP